MANSLDRFLFSSVNLVLSYRETLEEGIRGHKPVGEELLCYQVLRSSNLYPWLQAQVSMEWGPSRGPASQNAQHIRSKMLACFSLFWLKLQGFTTNTSSLKSMPFVLNTYCRSTMLGSLRLPSSALACKSTPSLRMYRIKRSWRT
jgi:hypothetical protein